MVCNKLEILVKVSQHLSYVFLKKKSQENPITLKNSQDQNPKSSANSDYHAAGQPTCHNSGIVYQCS